MAVGNLTPQVTDIADCSGLTAMCCKLHLSDPQEALQHHTRDIESEKNLFRPNSMLNGVALSSPSEM